MSMVCPQCKKVFAQHLDCPQCKVRLQFQAVQFTDAPRLAAEEKSEWQQTPWGRMAIGLLLAQGLGYALQQMVTAGFLASGEQATVWTTLWGILLLHGMQGCCLLIGGALCGAGNARGPLYGGLVGLVNGIIFLFLQNRGGESLNEVLIIGQPILHMAFGAIGGLLGMLIWKPTPTIPWEEPAAKTPSPTGTGWAFKFLSGPIHPARVVVGTVLVVMGVFFSNQILDFVLDASQGKLTIRSHLQAKLVGWQVAGLVILVGAGLAGACTFNGLKQGLCVGLAGGIILVGLQLGDPKINLETILFTSACVFALSIAGGWFGGQLFPPVLAQRRRHSILDG